MVINLSEKLKKKKKCWEIQHSKFNTKDSKKLYEILKRKVYTNEVLDVIFKTPYTTLSLILIRLNGENGES